MTCMKMLNTASWKNSCGGHTCAHAQVCPYQPFTGHDAGKVDHLQVGRLRDQRVRRQRDDVVAYPCQGLTLERAEEKKRNGESDKKGNQVIEIGFGPWGMLWPSWRRWNRNHFIRSFHAATSITPAHKLFPVTACPQAWPKRHNNRQNNTSLIQANPRVHRWHFLTSKLHSTNCIWGYLCFLR